MSHSFIGRYAPSPSGRLHIGNIMSSLLAWLDVRSHDGTLVFRLEDLDPDRSDYEYAALMAEDLQWLGLYWDEGWFPGTHRVPGHDTMMLPFRFLMKKGCCIPVTAADPSGLPHRHLIPARKETPAVPAGI